MMKNLIFAASLLTLLAIVTNPVVEIANAEANLSKTGLPLDMPLMPEAEIIKPIKVRSGGKIHEAIFKVMASPREVVEFYKNEMVSRNYSVKEEYADDVGLSSWGETDKLLLSMKGSTNKRDTSSAKQLMDGETRVLFIGKFKEME